MKLRLVETQFIKEEDSQNKAFQDIVYDVFDGSDFMIGNVNINEDGVDFDVTAMGPDGSMERHVHLAIPSYEEQLRWACEDWMSDHSTPDSFYESNLKESKLDDLTNGTYSTFKDYNEEYKNSPTMKYSEARPYDLEAMKIWIDAREGLTYTDNPNIEGDWYQLDITGGNHTKYGTNFIYIEPKQKLWRTRQTGEEFYKCGGRPDFKGLLNDSEEIKKDDAYPKDDYMIDPETASIDEIQAWLDKNNDKSEHSDDFNKLWLDIYKYLQRKKEKEGIKDSEESEATQTEDIAKKEEYKNMVTPTFKVGKKISLED